VVGSVVEVEESQSSGYLLAQSDQMETSSGRRRDQDVLEGAEEAAENLSDFDMDMQQFEIRSLCEMLQSEMSSDAKSLRKQERDQRRHLQRHLERMRYNQLDGKANASADLDFEAWEQEVAYITQTRKPSRMDESKSEDVIQQISLRSLNMDALGQNSSNEKALEFTPRIPKKRSEEPQEYCMSKSPEPPHDQQSDMKTPQQVGADLQHTPLTSRNEGQVPSDHQMISENRSSQRSMNLQNLQALQENMRPSVDSKFLAKDEARISKISKNQGDQTNPISQQISHRSFLNHAKHLFPDEPFAQEIQENKQDIEE